MLSCADPPLFHTYVPSQYFFGSGATEAYVKHQKREWFAQHGEYMPAAEQEALRASLPPLVAQPDTERIRVLDVGSCYNPHQVWLSLVCSIWILYHAPSVRYIPYPGYNALYSNLFKSTLFPRHSRSFK